MRFLSFVTATVGTVATLQAAQAADAIVASEPEAVEYVRVCDAFGTGFFYIPGTETCLKIGGHIRTQVDYNSSAEVEWTTLARGQVDFDARNDTEIGTIRSLIGLRGNVWTGVPNSVSFDQAFIEVAGFTIGYARTWWFDDLYGETDFVSSNNPRASTVRYTYKNGEFYAGVAAEELHGSTAGGFSNIGINAPPINYDNAVGISATIGQTNDTLATSLLVSYDTELEQGAVKGMVMAKIGPGGLGVTGVVSNGATFYYKEAEWTVAADYYFNVTDKLTVAPGVQYLDTVDRDGSGEFIGNRDAWRVGVTADYVFTKELWARATLNYQDVSGPENVNGGGDTWTGFMRLQRDF